jgi:signal transduction histidine kinase
MEAAPASGGRLLQGDFGRRREDRLIRDLLNVGQVITSEIDMDVLFRTITQETDHIMDVERSTMFVYDDSTNGLWSFNSAGEKKRRVHASPTRGLAGWVFSQEKPVIVNDPGNDSRFCPEIDGIPGLKTRSILGVPLVNRHRRCVGVYQALNKMSSEGVCSGFTGDDLELLSSLSPFVVIALENSRLYEETKRLDKTKERVINHIAHEMKTPLALISVTLNRVCRKIGEGNAAGLEESLGIARRNVERLLGLQEKIDDIVNEKEFDQKALMMHIIEDAFGVIEMLKEQHAGYNSVLEHVSHYIDNFYSVPEVKPEEISLHHFLQQVCRFTSTRTKERSLEIVTDFAEGVVIVADRGILWKTCIGLLKNAIENTPDEGRIEVTSGVADGNIIIGFRDYGVGITEENRRMVFGGFFHTQDTAHYSSKEPYVFNAGGAGADLLRIKVFSERCGFSIGFESTRCHALPEDADLCPGRISKCRRIHDKSECSASGGSLFTVTFGPQFMAG